MKKTFVFALALASFSLLNLDAKAQSDSTQQATQQPQTTQAPAQEEQKQQIKPEELPDAVKESLKSDALKDWTVSEVYKIAPDAADATAKPTYEVFFTNAEQKQAKARFGEDGKVVKE
ncbi:hypothetical protein I2I11_06600 [Pontibacter sp. 172403-2]|uniref:hypothetical protein n=1 Tax=Pontibacter rufus TaxID=2791028 RepID=UPI0018AFACC5|nr:hypothetical protein [Pontibacter sp. 172403-2]MBF9252954.1 hypothetical protein [Pontibacter sp. 172403-2]